MELLLRPYQDRGRARRGTPVAERLARYIDYQGDDQCWEWRAETNGIGYGRITISDQGERVHHYVHRFIYEQLVGPIPTGMQIDHLCRNRLCCNPAHLEPVVQAENIRRGSGFTAVNAAKTHCVHGHPFDETNTGYCPKRPERRVCLECRNNANARRGSRAKAAT